LPRCNDGRRNVENISGMIGGQKGKGIRIEMSAALD
jgi:hypothetical protein